MMDAADVAFLKKFGLYSGKKEEKVFLGGAEAQLFIVDEIRNMRMTVKDGAPALIFHKVPIITAPNETWVLSFPQHGKKNFLPITTSEELRAVGKAIVSGVSSDVKYGYLERTYDDFNDEITFPVFLPQNIVNWQKKLEDVEKKHEQLRKDYNALGVAFEELKHPGSEPQTETSGGPPAPPPPLPPQTAVVAPAPGGPRKDKSWIRSFIIFIVVTAVVLGIVITLINLFIRPK